MNVKLKVGTRLLQERDARGLNQAEMSELLSVSPSTYSRLERNLHSVDVDQLLNFSKALDIPIHEFLPETISIYNNENKKGSQGHIGLLIGNVFNYSDKETAETANKLLAQENNHLKEKNALLEARINDLEKRIKDLENIKK